MKNVPLHLSAAKHMGRVYCKNENVYLIHSGSGVGFSFCGKELYISAGCDQKTLNSGHQCNYPRIAILVDGRPVVKKVISEEKERYRIILSDAAENHEVKIIKLSEAAFSIAVLYAAETDDDAFVTPLAEKELKIEFIGDSITCGYGVDDSNVEGVFSTAAENAMKSYAYLTSELLNADYSMFAYSGYGLISGYTSDGVRNTREILPQYYESCGFSYGTLEGEKPQDIPWDFSLFVPDITVINLGTNDNSFCIKNEGAFEEFEGEYCQLIGRVRKCLPNTKIICTIGMIGVETAEYIKRAAEGFGDSEIFTFFFRPQDGLLGYGAQWHPSEDTHRYAAEELAVFIREIL